MTGPSSVLVKARENYQESEVMSLHQPSLQAVPPLPGREKYYYIKLIHFSSSIIEEESFLLPIAHRLEGKRSSHSTLSV